MNKRSYLNIISHAAHSMTKPAQLPSSSKCPRWRRNKINFPLTDGAELHSVPTKLSRIYKQKKAILIKRYSFLC
jgi:hypothetical protein